MQKRAVEVGKEMIHRLDTAASAIASLPGSSKCVRNRYTVKKQCLYKREASQSLTE